MHDAGADMYTFHHEATQDPAACARTIKEAGMKVSESRKEIDVNST